MDDDDDDDDYDVDDDGDDGDDDDFPKVHIKDRTQQPCKIINRPSYINYIYIYYSRSFIVKTHINNGEIMLNPIKILFYPHFTSIFLGEITGFQLPMVSTGGPRPPTSSHHLGPSMGNLGDVWGI